MTKECCERMSYDLDQKCDEHASKFDCPDALILKTKDQFGIIIHDGGTSSITINYCPWCGSSLKAK